MKKKILFIISSLRCGGAEHALVSLLSAMDYEKYDIDLLVLNEKDMFYKSSIPEEVCLVKPDFSVRAVFEPTLGKIIACLYTGQISLFFIHIKRILRRYVKKEYTYKNFWSYYWMLYKDHIKEIDKQYDVAIGYLEGVSNYFCADKVIAKKKIGWIHTNYADSCQNEEMDREYFLKLDYLVTMSEPASSTLADVFPEYRDKIYTIHNILDEEHVIGMAKEFVALKKKDGEIILVSVGNVLPVKGYDMAVEACAKLVEYGIKVKWYVLGRKDRGREIEELIEKYSLQDIFVLVGMQKNPYKYINMADIYVQCSRYEGFSTTIREAKILCKPIVATNCQGISDQIENNINGTLVDINSDSIFKGILELIENPSKQEKYISKLEYEAQNFETAKREMDKLYQLLD